MELMKKKREMEDTWRMKRSGGLGERDLAGDGGGDVRVRRRHRKMRGGCWCYLTALVVVLTWHHREGLIIVDVVAHVLKMP